MDGPAQRVYGKLLRSMAYRMGQHCLGRYVGGLPLRHPAYVRPGHIGNGTYLRHGSQPRTELVAEIEYRGWTGDGKLRHASFKGLREAADHANILLLPVDGEHGESRSG
jgi:hypothetical protein